MRINFRFGEKRNVNLILKVNYYFFSNVLIFGGGRWGGEEFFINILGCVILWYNRVI